MRFHKVSLKIPSNENSIYSLYILCCSDHFKFKCGAVNIRDIVFLSLDSSTQFFFLHIFLIYFRLAHADRKRKSEIFVHESLLPLKAVCATEIRRENRSSANNKHRICKKTIAQMTIKRQPEFTRLA